MITETCGGEPTTTRWHNESVAIGTFLIPFKETLTFKVHLRQSTLGAASIHRPQAPRYHALDFLPAGSENARAGWAPEARRLRVIAGKTVVQRSDNLLSAPGGPADQPHEPEDVR